MAYVNVTHCPKTKIVTLTKTQLQYAVPYCVDDVGGLLQWKEGDLIMRISDHIHNFRTSSYLPVTNTTYEPRFRRLNQGEKFTVEYVGD